jgi:hypothetical protein
MGGCAAEVPNPDLHTNGEAAAFASSALLHAKTQLEGEQGSPDAEAVIRELEDGLRRHARVVRMQVVTRYEDPAAEPVERILWGVFNGNPDQTRILYVFTDPELPRGASLLIHDNRGLPTESSIWLYLPSFGSLSRLTGRGAGLLIPGMALSYEDARSFIRTHLYEFTLAPAASHPRTGAGLIVLAEPRTSEIRENVGYGSLTIRVDEAMGLITRIVYTGRNGQPLKRYEVLESLRFAERWFPRRVRIEHFELGWVTEIEFEYHGLSAPIYERFFETISDEATFLPRLLRLLESEGIPSSIGQF